MKKIVLAIILLIAYSVLLKMDGIKDGEREVFFIFGLLSFGFCLFGSACLFFGEKIGMCESESVAAVWFFFSTGLSVAAIVTIISAFSWTLIMLILATIFNLSSVIFILLYIDNKIIKGLNILVLLLTLVSLVTGYYMI